MHRGTGSGRPAYSCPTCHQTISRIEDYVVEQFLWAKGERTRFAVVEEVHEGGAALLPEIEVRLGELGKLLHDTDDDGEAERLTAEMAGLRQLRREAREKAPVTVLREVGDTVAFAEAWADAADVEARREVLDDALNRVVIRRGRVGRGLDTSRLTFEWKFPGQVGPVGEGATDYGLTGWATA